MHLSARPRLRTGPSSSTAGRATSRQPSAHNGWIEIWLAGGAGLVAVFGLHTLITLGALIRRLRQGGRETYWAVLFTLAFIGFSMSESSILQQNDLTWVLFVAASAKVLAGERMPRLPRD